MTETVSNSKRVAKPVRKKAAAQPAKPEADTTEVKSLPKHRELSSAEEKAARKAGFLKLISFDSETEELEAELNKRKFARSEIIGELAEKYGVGPWRISDGKEITFVLHTSRYQNREPLWTMKQRSNDGKKV